MVAAKMLLAIAGLFRVVRFTTFAFLRRLERGRRFVWNDTRAGNPRAACLQQDGFWCRI